LSGFAGMISGDFPERVTDGGSGRLEKSFAEYGPVASIDLAQVADLKEMK
jgi:hypothetical protein